MTHPDDETTRPDDRDDGPPTLGHPLKHQFDEAMPEPPDTSGWASRAVLAGVRRRRRIRTALGSVSAVVVLVAVVFGASQVFGDRVGRGAGGTSSDNSGSAAAEPADSGSHGPVEPTVKPSDDPGAPLTPQVQSGCPADQKAYADPTQAVTLPEGPVSMRWCTWSGGGVFLTEWAPPEPLAAGAASEWVTAFNARAAGDPNGACRSDFSTPALALLTYPDGSTRSVAGMAAGCGTMGGRQGFTELRQKAIELFQTQRGPDFSPSTVDHEPCSAWRSTIPADLAKVSQVVVCGPLGASGPRTVKYVAPSAIPGLVADFQQNSEAIEPAYADDGSYLYLYQANGEMVVLAHSTQADVWFTVGEQSQRVWRPSTASTKAIEGATANPSAPISSSAGSPPPSGRKDSPPPTPKR